MESLGERSKRMDGENVGQWVATVESENWVKLSENRREKAVLFAHQHRVTESNSHIDEREAQLITQTNLPSTIGVQSTMAG